MQIAPLVLSATIASLAVSEGIAELVPREPRSAPAEVAAQAAVPGGSDAWHLVLQRPLSRRRTHEDIRILV
jgi:hypothetical protein